MRLTKPSEADLRHNPPETLKARELLWDIVVSYYAHKHGLVGEDHDANALKLSKLNARGADLLELL